MYSLYNQLNRGMVVTSKYVQSTVLYALLVILYEVPNNFKFSLKVPNNTLLVTYNATQYCSPKNKDVSCQGFVLKFSTI